MSSIEERFRAVVLDRRGEEVLVLSDNLGVDSLEKLDLLVGLEEEFKIKVSDQEMQQVVTFQDAIELIKGKIGQA